MGPTELSARVKAVVEASGLSQAEFASKSGLDASKFSKSLSGTRRFTSLDLANIADLAGVTVDHLLTGSSSIPAVAARAVEVDGDGARAAILQAEILAQHRASLAFLGYGPWPVPRPALGSGTKIEQGLRLANEALKLLPNGVASIAQVDIAGLVEQTFGVDISIASIPDGCDGLAWQDRHCSIIVLAATDKPTRQRFTLAHELGHLLAGDDQQLHVDANVMARRHGDRSEMRANVFASAFLMPEDLLRSAYADFRVNDNEAFAHLAMQMVVSPDALAFRLANLKLISEETRYIFSRMTAASAALKSGRGGDLNDWIAASKSPRVPSALTRDLLTAYLDGRSTLRPYANLMGTPVDALRDMLEAVGPDVDQTGELTFSP